MFIGLYGAELAEKRAYLDSDTNHVSRHGE